MNDPLLDAALALSWCCGYAFHAVPDENDILVTKLQGIQVRLLGEPDAAELLVARSEIDWCIGFVSASGEESYLQERLEEVKRTIEQTPDHP